MVFNLRERPHRCTRVDLIRRNMNISAVIEIEGSHHELQKHEYIVSRKKGLKCRFQSMQNSHLYADIFIGSMGLLICKIIYKSIHIKRLNCFNQYNNIYKQWDASKFSIFLPYFWDFSINPSKHGFPKASDVIWHYHLSCLIRFFILWRSVFQWKEEERRSKEWFESNQIFQKIIPTKSTTSSLKF